MKAPVCRLVRLTPWRSICSASHWNHSQLFCVPVRSRSSRTNGWNFRQRNSRHAADEIVGHRQQHDPGEDRVTDAFHDGRDLQRRFEDALVVLQFWRLSSHRESMRRSSTNSSTPES